MSSVIRPVFCTVAVATSLISTGPVSILGATHASADVSAVLVALDFPQRRDQVTLATRGVPRSFRSDATKRRASSPIAFNSSLVMAFENISVRS